MSLLPKPQIPSGPCQGLQARAADSAGITGPPGVANTGYSASDRRRGASCSTSCTFCGCGVLNPLDLCLLLLENRPVAAASPLMAVWVTCGLCAPISDNCSHEGTQWGHWFGTGAHDFLALDMCLAWCWLYHEYGLGGRVSMETRGSPSLHCECCENKAESLIWPLSLAQALNMFVERRRRRSPGPLLFTYSILWF